MEDNSLGKQKRMKEFMVINLGILLIAIGIHFFNNTNKFALGGVTGLSVVLSFFFPSLPIGVINLIINTLLLVIAFFAISKEFAIKTAYGAFVLSGAIILLEILFPLKAPLTNQRLLELLYGVFLPGIGVALTFSTNASTGGIEIIAKIISIHFKIKLSIPLLVLDFTIALSAGIIFGIETCLFSVLGVCMKIFVLDSFMESLIVNKIVVIVSEKSKEVQNYICNNLSRGATVHFAHGAFTIVEKEVITTVLSRNQAKRLQMYINDIDPNAFVTITNSSRIVGKGFRYFD